MIHWRAMWVMMLLLVIILLGQAEDKPKPSPADQLWNQVLKATDADAWDDARKLLESFIKRYPDDSRTPEATARLSGNAFLKIAPYCINGPKENRIDLYMSADGLLSTQEDQTMLRQIVELELKEALRLAPFDVYWSYFNWYIVHAGSAKHGINKGPTDETYFGGRHGYRSVGEGDAFMDEDEHVAHDFALKYFPDYDFFLVCVDGWNGWPRGDNICVVGTCNFRYMPQVMSNGRLYANELGPGCVQPYPEIQEKLDRALEDLKLSVKKESEKYKGLSVRQWRQMTALWDIQMVKGVGNVPKSGEGGKRGPRDPQTGRSGYQGGELNNYQDTRVFPDIHDPRERLLPSLDKLPWYHWLLKGDPTVTIVPAMKVDIWGFSTCNMRPIPKGTDWMDAVTWPTPKTHTRQWQAMLERYGGKPSREDILKDLRLRFMPHERCHIAGGSTIKLGGYNTAPQFCAVCREETVRSFYRFVSPIDDYEPKEEILKPERPLKTLKFSVLPMKPLDHFLIVEWKIDGTLQKANKTERTWIRKKDGKSVSWVMPDFPVSLRKEAGFDPRKYKSGASKKQLESAFAHAEYAVKETLRLDPSTLSPGTHIVEATVTDETPWVLWDPENLLTQTMKWTLEIPDKQE